MNQIHNIKPYWEPPFWVFDDPDKGLIKEAFVDGADTVMQHLCDEVKGDPCSGFHLTFSGGWFPAANHSFKLVGPGIEGAYYYSEEMKLCGWLCPALFKYFDKPPKKIYLRAKQLEIEYESITIGA